MITDIINKKRLGKELSFKELAFFFNGYLAGNIKDYQMSSLLMAICTMGMSDEEIYSLTKIFIDSGEILSYPDIKGIKVDKHSTGGVGDKTTLIVVPIVASLGIPVIKMSGRGLGFTGGTIDKLESIPGYKTNLSKEEIIKQVKDIGCSISGATSELAPMDKKIYALRDVTGTVEAIPLIASSIMSKKIAGGADKILIDIKVGRGALIKNKKEANKLSSLMKKIGKFYNREVRTIISDMNTPLGTSIGNSLEVREAIDILNNKEHNTNLYKLCLNVATTMVSMGKGIVRDKALRLVKTSLKDGSAYNKFLELVKYQGGDITKVSISTKSIAIKSNLSGIVKKIDAYKLGELSVRLGAGRATKEDLIDYGVGIVLNKLVGDTVNKGDTLYTLYIEDVVNLNEVEDIYEIN